MLKTYNGSCHSGAVSIKLASLDGADVNEIIAAPVRYTNGRDNKWWEPLAETRHL
jgi:hypothetical protein